ncbi:hypothetical protein [Pantanalinema sp. GBBB05]
MSQGNTSGIIHDVIGNPHHGLKPEAPEEAELHVWRQRQYVNH